MNEQEEFWSGDFGREYTDRNTSVEIIANNMKFLARVVPKEIIRKSSELSLIEFGANSGMNLRALGLMGFKPANMTAVEINEYACVDLESITGVSVYNCSMFAGDESWSFGQYDVVLASGLLIHISQEDIDSAYDILHESCKPGGLIIIVDYFAPTPTPVAYRGHENKLWRRNTGKDMLVRHADLSLLNYGFVADIDPVYPRDNVNWWTLVREPIL